jgi:hypothetical protein
MYLAILLIAVSILVFYNEFNKHMNFAEIAILAITLIIIIKASMNYMMLDISVKEGFTNTINRSRKNKKNDVVILESNKSQDYLDTDVSEIDSVNNRFENTYDKMNKSSEGKIDNYAVNKINSVLSNKGNLDYMMHSSKSNFTDINPEQGNSEPTNINIVNQDMESLFVPKIIIGKSSSNSSNRSGRSSGTLLGCSSMNSSTWDTSFKDDGMTFSNRMTPTHNLWEDNLGYMDSGINWTQNLDSYNKGKWDSNLYKKPSDYTDFYKPVSRGESITNNTILNENFGNTSNTSNTSLTSTTLDSNGQSQRLCGAYDDLSMEQVDNLVVNNYTEAKKWYPGYTYVPPVYWDVPQRRVSVCQSNSPNVRKLTGLIDRGLPINALELNPDGSIADNESDVKLTNVGSVLPKFTYIEEPYSKPYV